MDFLRWCKVQADRASALALAAAGVVALVLGWIGVSQALYPAEQLPYLISGGVGALFLLGLAGTLWLSAELRDEWRKLDRMEEVMRDFVERYDAEMATDPGAVEAASTEDPAPLANGTESRGRRGTRRALRASANNS